MFLRSAIPCQFASGTQPHGEDSNATTYPPGCGLRSFLELPYWLPNHSLCVLACQIDLCTIGMSGSTSSEEVSFSFVHYSCHLTWGPGYVRSGWLPGRVKVKVAFCHLQFRRVLQWRCVDLHQKTRPDSPQFPNCQSSLYIHIARCTGALERSADRWLLSLPSELLACTGISHPDVPLRRHFFRPALAPGTLSITTAQGCSHAKMAQLPPQTIQRDPQLLSVSSVAGLIPICAS